MLSKLASRDELLESLKVKDLTKPLLVDSIFEHEKGIKPSPPLKLDDDGSIAKRRVVGTTDILQDMSFLKRRLSALKFESEEVAKAPRKSSILKSTSHSHHTGKKYVNI